MNNQRTAKKQGKLSAEHIQRLETLGFAWDPMEALWEAAYQQLVAYKAENDDCNVPRKHKTKDGFSLGTWVANQRQAEKRGDISDERRDRLKDLGLVWDLRKALPK